jgi:hypothetical protein
MSTRSALTAIVWLALALSAIVWIMRISSAVALDRPFLGNTSGCEEEALFSVWKAANGYEVYNNPWLPPFSASYFGWLFYQVYGWWAKAGLAVSGLEDAWLPTFTRIFTLIGLLACIGVFYRLLQTGANRAATFPPSLLFGLAALVFINPLFHWWAFTTRADVWALAWELAALLAAFCYAKSGRARAVVLVGVFAFLAWSFRQTNISVLAGFGLWLLVNRRWKVLLPMVASMAVAFGVTMAVLGMNFIDSAFTANALSGDMRSSVAIANASSALTKDPLLTLALGAAFVLVFFAGKWWHDNTSRLAFLVAATSVFLAAALAAKVGASSNYYLPPAALVPLFVLVALSRCEFSSFLNAGFIGAGAAGIGLASALVLSGASGNLRSPGDERLHEMRALRRELREPVFSTDRVVNLPWILGNGPESYVFGYAYQRMLEAKPEKFTGGTIADLLRGGRFSTLIMLEDSASYVATAEELADFTSAGGTVREVRKR